MKTARSIQLATGIWVVCSVHSQGAVVIDTFDEGGGFHPQFNLVAAAVNYGSFSTNAVRLAVQFPVESDEFESVTLPISV